MSAVEDVAVHILDRLDTVSTMKLQKLVYYSQAYNLVRYNTPLFPEKIEAWVNGPVVPKLYEAHKNNLWLTHLILFYPVLQKNLTIKRFLLSSMLFHA